MEDSVALKIRDVYQGVEKVSAGYKMLAAMGWQEGEGLGANKQGMKTHIKAVKKFDSAGVGATEAVRRTQDWTLGMTSFTTILSGLQEVTSTPDYSAYAESSSNEDGSDAESESGREAKRDSGSDSGSSSSDGEDAPAAVVAAAAMGSVAAKRAAEAVSAGASKKRKLAEVSGGKEGAAAPASKTGKLALHTGRYTKRELNKSVVGYSAADLAAILGQKSAEDAEEHMAARSNGGAAAGNAADAKTPARAAVAAAARLSRMARESVVIAVQPREGDVTAWWRHMYHRAGIVGRAPGGRGAQAADKKKITVHGFSEADQTALYTRTQDNATTGRKGLGGTRTGKQADADWAGTKIRLGSDDEGSDDEEAAAAEAEDDGVEYEDPASDVLPGGVTIVWAGGVRPAWFLKLHGPAAAIDEKGSEPEPKGSVPEPKGSAPKVDCAEEGPRKSKKSKKSGKDKSEKSETDTPAAAAAAPATPAEGAQFSGKQRKDCRRAAKKALQEEASGSLSLKKLRKRVAKAMASDSLAAADLLERVSGTLSSDTAFRIQKGVVALAT